VAKVAKVRILNFLKERLDGLEMRSASEGLDRKAQITDHSAMKCSRKI
jgi:hypothetical protein